MSGDQGKKWVNRDPDVAWIEPVLDDDGNQETFADGTPKYKIKVVIHVPSNTATGWEDDAKHKARAAAVEPILSEAGLYDPTGLVSVETDIHIEEGPILGSGMEAARPKSPSILLCSIEATYTVMGPSSPPVVTLKPDAAVGNLDWLENISDDSAQSDLSTNNNDYVHFENFSSFAKRLEILALRFEEEYAVKTRKEGVAYWGPEESYGAFVFEQEANALRDFYREVHDLLVKNGRSLLRDFKIMFITEKWDSANDMEAHPSTHVDDWIAGVGASGIAIVDANDLRLPIGNEMFNTNPLLNDVRRLWLIRRIVESTGKMAPFADYSTDISVDPTDISQISFGCKSPAFSKEVPQFTHDDFVKRFVRPKPDLAPSGMPSDGTGGWAKQAAHSLIEWNAFADDFYAARDEVSTQRDKKWGDNILREVVQNRRRSTSEYLGDYFMKNLPGAPAKIRSLHDVWTHVLSRMDFPTLIQEGLECMWAGYGLSLEDVLDALCEEMITNFFEETTIEQMDQFAKTLDEGGPIPSNWASGDEYLSKAGLNRTDLALAIRGALEDGAGKLAESDLSSTKLSPETQEAIQIAFEDRLGKGDWKRFLCDAIMASPYLFGRGIYAIWEAIQRLKEEDTEPAGKEQIPPFKKCDNSIDSLRDVPIIGTLYDKVIREAKKKIDEAVLAWIEKELVEPCRTWLWQWESACIEDGDGDISKMGALSSEDFPKTAEDSKRLQEFFGDGFDFERFLNSLFAGLTDRELCGLLRGEIPTDKVARYIVQFVKNYAGIPTKIANRVSEKSKVLPFFGTISGYINKSVCDNLSKHPENLISGPCDSLDLNYAEQMMRTAMKNRGFSESSINQQIKKQKELIKEDLKNSISAMAKTSNDFQLKLQEDIKKQAQESLKDIMSSDTSAFALSLDAILNVIKSSFKGSMANFYLILLNDQSLYEQIFVKLSHLIDNQQIFGEDTKDFTTNENNEVSKYHNYVLEIDSDQVYIPTEEEEEAGIDTPPDPHDICEEIIRHKQLMVNIMSMAGWDSFVQPTGINYPNATGPKGYAPGQRGSYWESGYGGIPGMNPSNNWTGESWRLPQRYAETPSPTYPQPYRLMSQFAKDAQADTALDTYTWNDKISNFFQGNIKIGSIFGNLYDPANLLNPYNQFFIGDLPTEVLDDLFRIAFRYYTRYSYNYEFNPENLGNYFDGEFGTPKPECLVLNKKFTDTEIPEEYWGYASFTIDPVHDLDDLQVAEHLKWVDFRCGHRGPGVTPFNAQEDKIDWSGLLSMLTTQHPAGIPLPYIKSLEWFNSSTPSWAWGNWENSSGGGWALNNSKECLLRLFLFRFILQGLNTSYTQHEYAMIPGAGGNTEGTTNWEAFADKDELEPTNPGGGPGFPPETKPLMIAIVGALSPIGKFPHPDGHDVWDNNDYNNLIGGHMERAVCYYEYGLDFHPGFKYFQYGEGNFEFNEQQPGFGGVLSQLKNISNVHTLPFNKFKYSELAESIFQYNTDDEIEDPNTDFYNKEFMRSMGLKTDGDDDDHYFITEIDNVQPVADEFGNVPEMFTIAESGDKEGQKVAVFHHESRPKVINVVKCVETPSLGVSITIPPDAEGVVQFSLLAQMSPELLPLSHQDSTGCIIDRYALKTTWKPDPLIPTEVVSYEETTKLVGIVGPLKGALKDSSGNPIVDSSDKGRFEKIKEVLEDPDILENPIIAGEENLGGNVDWTHALQPSVFEQYFVKKMRNDPIGLLPFVNPYVGEKEYGSTLLEDIILPQLLINGVGFRQLYGVIFRDLLKKIARLIYGNKPLLDTTISDINYSSLEINLDTIKDNALKCYQALADKIDPMGDPFPSIEEVFLSTEPVTDDVGNEYVGAVAAKILIKIVIIEYFMKTIGTATTFSVQDTMQDELMINFLMLEIGKLVEKFYKDKPAVYKPNEAKIKKLVKQVIENEIADIIDIFSNFFQKQYEDAVDQTLLKDNVYDLARTKNGLPIYYVENNKIPVLGIKSFTAGQPASFSLYAEPRFSYITAENISIGPGPDPDNPGEGAHIIGGTVNFEQDKEGLLLEKYVKIQFHSREKIKENLKKSPNVSDAEANQIAEDIMALPVEHKGDMRFGIKDKNVEGEPVYLNLDEFKLVFNTIFNGAPLPYPCGSIFNWKQLEDPNGFKEEFDLKLEEAITDYDSAVEKDEEGDPIEDEEGNVIPVFPYENEAAGQIQKELAFLEQLCTLVSHETQIDSGHSGQGDAPCSTCGTLWELDPGLVPAGYATEDFKVCTIDDTKPFGEKITCDGDGINPPGKPLPYSDLSYKSMYTYTKIDGSGDPESPEDLNFAYYHHYWKGLNQLPLEDCRYIPWTKLAETRPYSLKYLEHLNGNHGVFDNATTKKLISMFLDFENACKDLPWSENTSGDWDDLEGDNDDVNIWSSIALAPLMTKKAFDKVIPEDHRKLLANIGFRYYTVKYFGDYSGFTFDPYKLTKDQLSQIFRGDKVSINHDKRYKGFPDNIVLGDYYGEAKGIAEMMFPDDPIRRELASKPGKGLFLGPDPDAKCGLWMHHEGTVDAGWYKWCTTARFFWGAYYDPAAISYGMSFPPAGDSEIWEATALEQSYTNMSYPNGYGAGEGPWAAPDGPIGSFNSPEEWERYMIFGLFFGFDSVVKWKMLQDQWTDEALDSTGDGVADLGKFQGGLGNLPAGLTTVGSPPFTKWTSSYQRDLFNALRLYKGGIPGIDAPSPIEVFTNGKLISDYMPSFYTESESDADALKLSNYAKKASYGLRLSCLLPDHSGGNTETKAKPLAPFWDYIIPYYNLSPLGAGIPANAPESHKMDLLTDKRIKSYYFKELHKYGDPLTEHIQGGTVTQLYARDMFMIPLLEENYNILDKEFSSLLNLEDNWFEEGDMPGNDGTKENYQILYKNMKDKDEFKLLIDYVFPIKRILSLIAVWKAQTFIRSDTPEMLKNAFKVTKDLISKLSVTTKK